MSGISFKIAQQQTEKEPAGRIGLDVLMKVSWPNIVS